MMYSSINKSFCRRFSSWSTGSIAGLGSSMKAAGSVFGKVFSYVLLRDLKVWRSKCSFIGTNQRCDSKYRQQVKTQAGYPDKRQGRKLRQKGKSKKQARDKKKQEK